MAGLASTLAIFRSRELIAATAISAASDVSMSNLSSFFTAQNRQTRLKFLTARRGENGFDCPVFTRFEGLDFHFTFNDDAQGNGLNAACGFGSRQFAP